MYRHPSSLTTQALRLTDDLRSSLVCVLAAFVVPLSVPAVVAVIVPRYRRSGDTRCSSLIPRRRGSTKWSNVVDYEAVRRGPVWHILVRHLTTLPVCIRRCYPSQSSKRLNRVSECNCGVSIRKVQFKHCVVLPFTLRSLGRVAKRHTRPWTFVASETRQLYGIQCAACVFLQRIPLRNVTHSGMRFTYGRFTCRDKTVTHAMHRERAWASLRAWDSRRLKCYHTRGDRWQLRDAEAC